VDLDWTSAYDRARIGRVETFPTQRLYRCRTCRAIHPGWSACCPRCGQIGAMMPDGMKLITNELQGEKASRLITPLGEEPEEEVPRVSTGLLNLDELFGGGLALGSVVQLGGNPGIGKSTLLAQIAGFMHAEILYVTTEESKRRLARRARRVGGPSAGRVPSISTIDDKLGLAEVRAAMRTHPARVVIVDSLQGMRAEGSALETKGQNKKHSQYVVRDIALELIQEANARRLTILFTCHVTKDGALAGLKEIEHMVDVVAWFRGAPETPHRQVSCSKNRDGDTSIVAHFEMGPNGLTPRPAPARRGAAAAAAAAEDDGVVEIHHHAPRPPPRPAARPAPDPEAQAPAAPGPLDAPMPPRSPIRRAPIGDPEIDDDPEDDDEAPPF
jgi:DNA repair protein RadA/Sms